MTWYKTFKELTDEEINEITKSKWESVESSFIAAIAYSEVAGMLDIKMKNGHEYTFADVPKKVFDNFMETDSKGKFFNDVIRKNYTAK